MGTVYFLRSRINCTACKWWVWVPGVHADARPPFAGNGRTLVHQEMSRYLCHECMLRHPSLSFSSLTHGALSSTATWATRTCPIALASHVCLVSLFVSPCLEPTGAGQHLHEPEPTSLHISVPSSLSYAQCRLSPALFLQFPGVCSVRSHFAFRPRIFLIHRLPLARFDLLVLSCSMVPHQVPQRLCPVTCIMEGDFCERGEKMHIPSPTISTLGMCTTSQGLVYD